MTTKEEEVLVVPRAAFDRLGAFQGVSLQVDLFLEVLLQADNLQFLPRSLAEEDPSFKQLIPYVIVTHDGKILRYFRGGSSGEKRLVAKASVGVGGHINREDHLASRNGTELYDLAVQRELQEELHLDGEFSHRIIALLNDDSNAVGQVHLGVVHHLVLDDAGVRAAESALTDLQFLSHADILAERDLLETWSQIVMDHWTELA